MLDTAIKSQLRTYLQRLQQPIELVASLGNDGKSLEMRDLLREIAELSLLVSVREDGVDARKPSFAVTRPGEPARVRFAGIPMGHEFTSLVLALLQVGELNDFAIFTDDAFLSLYNQITGGIVALMTLIASVSLLVGGIGVMNIMLVAVTERTREIGVRKALGAPRRAILIQFLMEAVGLTAAGGALGILLGAGISWVVRAASPLPTYVSAWSVVLGLAFSAVVGVFFGLYPAMRASALDPVDSLRYE